MNVIIQARLERLRQSYLDEESKPKQHSKYPQSMNPPVCQAEFDIINLMYERLVARAAQESAWNEKMAFLESIHQEIRDKVLDLRRLTDKMDSLFRL